MYVPLRVLDFFRPGGRGQPALVLKCEGGGAAHVWSPTRGVGDAAPRVAAGGHGARHRRWCSGFFPWCGLQRVSRDGANET